MIIVKPSISGAIVLIILVLFGNPVRSQITLEHTYNGYAYVADLSVSGYKYYVLDTQNETLKLYHPDHSIWKTINLTVPVGYELMTAVDNVSENLFSLDDKVCFSYSYYILTPNYEAETKVINENGAVLLTITGANYAYAYDIEGEAKLLAYITNYSTNFTTTKVYDLPGNLTSGENQLFDKKRLPFPNPAQNSILIPYNPDDMKLGGTIRIFGLLGNLVREYNVDSNFDKLTIDSSTFPPETYFYKINNSTGEVDSGKFLIR
jgi:hypothetical protein